MVDAEARGVLVVAEAHDLAVGNHPILAGRRRRHERCSREEIIVAALAPRSTERRGTHGYGGREKQKDAEKDAEAPAGRTLPPGDASTAAHVPVRRRESVVVVSAHPSVRRLID